MRPNTSEEIRAGTITIGNLLTAENRLAVPPYQRPYDWSKEEANDLLDDLRSAIEGNYSPFFGTIVIDDSDSECYQIIDGQQRITTFNLLLIALRTIANKNGATEDIRQSSKIHGVLTYENKISGKNTDSLSRLDPSISIKNVYLPISTNQDWDGKSYPDKGVKLKVRKIKPILDFFLEECSKLKHDEIAQMLQTLYSGYVIILKIKDKTEALEIFEHANVRGMELNAADLLKSYFVTNISDQKDVDLENHWLEIVSNTENVIRMIKHFGWTMFKKQIVANRNKFYSELKEYGREHGGINLLNSFDQFAQAYGIVESGEIEDLLTWAEKNDLTEIAEEQKAHTFIRSLRGLRLFRVTQTYPLVAASLVNYKLFPSTTSANALIELTGILEKYHFINSFICQRRGNEVENLYAEKSKTIISSANELASNVNEIKNKLVHQLAGFVEFKSKFIEISYDTSAQTLKSIYYLFDRIENTNRKGREVEVIYNPRLAIVKGDWEVEHILSQKPLVPHSAIENPEEVINSIGNLLVVPSGTNKAVGNKGVIDKVKMYEERIGKMATVTNFCKNFKNGEFQSFNTKEDVDLRTDVLAKEVYGKTFAITKEQSAILD